MPETVAIALLVLAMLALVITGVIPLGNTYDVHR